jgi:hypothetical protein
MQMTQVKTKQIECSTTKSVILADNLTVCSVRTTSKQTQQGKNENSVLSLNDLNNVTNFLLHKYDAVTNNRLQLQCELGYAMKQRTKTNAICCVKTMNK